MDLFVLVGIVVFAIVVLSNKFGENGSGTSIYSNNSKSTGVYKDSKLSAEERRLEYRMRGKSPSGVIDGVYNDMYLEDGNTYNDMDRDWDADA